MRHTTSALIVAMFAVVLGGPLCGGPAPAQVARGDSPAVAADDLSLTKEFRVRANRVYELRVSKPDGKGPWHLHGHWKCQGRSADIEGATDDTLVRFALRGPDDKVVEELKHPVSGNFSIHFTEPGTYTFIFDNSGIIRSSARLITVEGTFEPD